MKKILLTVVFLISLNLAFASPHGEIEVEINSYLEEQGVFSGENAFRVIFDDSSQEMGVVFDSSSKMLSIQSGERRLELDISSFAVNKEMFSTLDNSYTPENVLIASRRDEKGNALPAITLTRGQDGSLDRLLTIIGSGKQTFVYWGTKELDTEDSRVIIVEHYDPDKDITDPARAEGQQRLTAVSNGRGEVIIENADLGVKTGQDGKIRLAVETVTKSGTLTPNREIDTLNIIGAGVIKVFSRSISDNVNLFIRFFYSFVHDALRDRLFRTESAPHPIEVIHYKPNERWTDELPTDYSQVQDCDEQNLCRMTFEYTGDDKVACFCTRIGNTYGYRNQDNEWCDIPKNSDALCLEDGKCAPYACEDGQTDPDCIYSISIDSDIPYGCCDGSSNCLPQGKCSKMGFMVLPTGYNQLYLNRIKDFTGKEGGYVLLIGLIGQNLEEISSMVKSAYAVGLTPVVRLLGPDWERSTPTAEEMAEYARQVKQNSGGLLEYVQVWNEPNIIWYGNDYFTNPETYARYVMDFKQSLNDPSIKIVSAALSVGEAGSFPPHERINSYDYFESMLNYAGFISSIDYWAYHSYDDKDVFDALKGRCDDEVVIPEYGSKVCGEGILGYRYYLNKIRKKTGSTPKVMLTELGYRYIYGDGYGADYRIKRDNLVKTIEAIHQDENVESAMIFLLNGFSEEWYQDSWIGDGQGNPPLPHMVEISNLACGGYSDSTGFANPSRNRKYEPLCEKGEFWLKPLISGLEIVEKGYGEKECRWLAAVKELSCNELTEHGLEEGRLYVRVYDQFWNPLNVNIKFDDIEKVSANQEISIICGDEIELESNLKQGFAYFDYDELASDISELYVYNPSDIKYDFSSDRLKFNFENYPRSRCGDRSKYSSLYVRFILECRKN